MQAYARYLPIRHATRILKLVFQAHELYGAKEHGVGGGTLMILVIRAATSYGFIKELTFEQISSPSIPLPEVLRTYSDCSFEGDRDNIATSDLIQAFFHFWSGFEFK